MKSGNATVRILIALLFLAPGSLAAQVPDENPLSIHGFLTQGWARAWDNPVAGIPGDAGTVDYRSVALQFGYRLGDADRLVLQFSHRRNGNSLLQDEHVALGWAFYERRFGEGTVRVGKVPLPGGMFNETRNVGTALPFFRAPLHFYLESAETLDGAVIGYRFRAQHPWSLYAEVSGGQFDLHLALNTPTGPVITTIDVRSAVGANLWLETPIAGTRIGVGASRYNETGSTGEALSGSRTWIISGESHLGRLTARAEIQQARSDEYVFDAEYAQLGFQIVPTVSLNLQTEYSQVTVATPVGDLDIVLAHDHALGLAWMVLPNAVLKIEGHRFKGFNVDTFYPLDAPTPKARYMIASISVGF
jgi:hypothetical protein